MSCRLSGVGLDWFIKKKRESLYPLLSPLSKGSRIAYPSRKSNAEASRCMIWLAISSLRRRYVSYPEDIYRRYILDWVLEFARFWKAKKCA